MPPINLLPDDASGQLRVLVVNGRGCVSKADFALHFNVGASLAEDAPDYIPIDDALNVLLTLKPALYNNPSMPVYAQYLRIAKACLEA